jgi:hypothetical protein
MNGLAGMCVVGFGCAGGGVFGCSSGGSFGGCVGGGGILLDDVFVHDDGDESGGGDGDESSDDAGEGGTCEQGDDDGEAEEIDSTAHDAGGEEAVFYLEVDDVEDEDAGHFAPGVGGGDACCEHDGDEAAGDGDDVEQAHQDAEEHEIFHVQEAEGDGAADAKDEHEGELANEPAAHAAFGDDEGLGEAVAGFGGDEGEEVVVDGIALEHEVDAEDEGGDEVEDAAEPEGSAGEDVLRGGGEGGFALLGDGVEAEFVRHGKVLELGNEAGDAGGEVGGKVFDIARNRGKADPEEEGEEGEDGEDDGNDGDGAGGRVVADPEPFDLLHDGGEDDGEESADVDQLEYGAKTPGEGEREGDREGKEDVAADAGGVAGLRFGGSLLIDVRLVRLERQRAHSRDWISGCSPLDARRGKWAGCWNLPDRFSGRDGGLAGLDQ